MRALAVVLALVAAFLLVSGAAGAPTATCTGAPAKVFDNTNGNAVRNGAKQPTFETKGKPGANAPSTRSRR
jgi:hypothetical protein